MGARELGARLFDVRRLRGLSLKAVADRAGISPAYLQKLERGEVTAPSPHVLHRLAEALRVSYSQLMKLAGYVLRRKDEAPGASILAQALNSEGLTEDELAALAAYLKWYRDQREQKEKRGD